MTKFLPATMCAITLTASVFVTGHQREPVRADLSGSWRLNQELSENAQAKLDRVQSSQGHGPGRHGFGGLLGRLFGGGDIHEARRLMVEMPSMFRLTQDGDRVVLTASDGRARTLLTNGQKERVNGRDVLTNWNNGRLVTEVSVGDVKVIEMYERTVDAAQLIITSRMETRGHDVSVRRVYDAEPPR